MEKIIKDFVLPCFSGFYNTVWDVDEITNPEIADWFDVDEDYVTEEVTDSFNFKKYAEAVGERCIGLVEEELERILKCGELNYYKAYVNSPKEYNFSNDDIVFDFKISDYDKFMDSLEKYIHEHYEYFQKCAKEAFTSYDGFMSFYPNDMDKLDWESDDTLLSWVLECVINNEDDDFEEFMHDNVGSECDPEFFIEVEPSEETRANDVIAHFKPQAQKYKNGSVLVKDKYSSLEFWMDIDVVDKDISCDWNQDTFNTCNSDDIIRKQIQENCDVFCDAESEATSYLQAIRVLPVDYNGNWFKTKDF